MKFKKGAIDNLFPVVIALVAIGVTLAIGFLILGEINSNPTVAADPNATSAVQVTTNAMADIPDWLPIIIITIIGAILIGLVSIFRGRR